MNKDIIVFDNFLPQYIQDRLEILCYNIPFYLSQTSTIKPLNSGYNDREQYVYLFWDNRKHTPHISEIEDLGHYFLLPLQIASMKRELCFKLKDNLTRAKINITHNSNNPTPQLKPPHKDLENISKDGLNNMLIAIYYVNDSDGDTIIYNEKEEFTDFSKYTIRERISSKKGRLVLFNGDLVHSASIPSSKYSKRIVINYNLTF